jgi:hypothetical protein
MASLLFYIGFFLICLQFLKATEQASLPVYLPGVESLIEFYLLRAGELPGAPLRSPADPATVVRTPLAKRAVGTGMLLGFFLVACHRIS